MKRTVIFIIFLLIGALVELIFGITKPNFYVIGRSYWWSNDTH